MTDEQDSISADVVSLLREILLEYQVNLLDGISEYELIRLLQGPPHELFNADALTDPLVLFQTHFILFHTLYQLRQEWRDEDVGDLYISAMSIKLQPMQLQPNNNKSEIAAADPLAEYYLNWQNLVDTQQEDVETLLSSFWLKMAGIEDANVLSEHQLQHYLDVLEWPEQLSLDMHTLKQQYRKLQHSNHPDKGGSSARSQQILQAYTHLRKHLTRMR